MTRSAWLVGISLAVASVATAAPASASPVRFEVMIVAHTDFTVESSQFESTLEGCVSGGVVDGPGGAHFTPWGGAFNGLKVFTCASGDSGFSVRLHARFDGGGSSGTWTLADAWGDLAGLKGSGTVLGIRTSDTSIDDVYTGTLR